MLDSHSRPANTCCVTSNQLFLSLSLSLPFFWAGRGLCLWTQNFLGQGSNPCHSTLFFHFENGQDSPKGLFSSSAVCSFVYLFIVIFFLFMATSVAYGSSWARAQTRAAAATYAAACGNTRSLTHWVGPGLEPALSHRDNVRSFTCWATMRTPFQYNLKFNNEIGVAWFSQVHS